MQIQVQIQGEMALLQKMAALSHFRKYAVMKNVAELLRSSTMDRFRSTQAPDGTKSVSYTHLTLPTKHAV